MNSVEDFGLVAFILAWGIFILLLLSIITAFCLCCNYNNKED